MSRHKKMIIVGIVLILVALGIFLVWRVAFSGVNAGLPRATVAIGNAVFSVDLATTMAQQSRGLSGRAGLSEHEGMLFAFGNPGVQNFWMKDMNFPIDIIWIGSTSLTAGGSTPSIGSGQVLLTAPGRTGKVLGFSENAEPQPGASLWALKIYTSPHGVDTVLEVPAGTVLKDGIKVGDNVTITN